MKRKISLFLAILLSLATVTASFSISVFAEGEEAMVEGGASYATLSEAITNVPANGKVVLLKDITLTSAISIPQDKKFTFSGGSYTVNYAANDVFAIAGTGVELTIADGKFVGTGNGNVVMVSANNTDAKITIDNAEITNMACNGHFIGCIVRMNSNCSVTINDGNYKFGSCRVIAGPDDNAMTNANLTINGGSFCSAFGRMFNMTGVNLTITGGSFTLDGIGWNTRPTFQFNAANVNISGGTFSTPIYDNSKNQADIPLFMVYGGTTLNISGGFFHNDMNASLLNIGATNVVTNITGGYFESQTDFATNRIQKPVIAVGGSKMNIYGGYFVQKSLWGQAFVLQNAGTSGEVNVWGGTFVSNNTGAVLRGADSTPYINVYGGQFIALAERGDGNWMFGNTQLNASFYTNIGKSTGHAGPSGVAAGSPALTSISGDTLYVQSNKAIPAMLDGAAVRLVKDSSGIRFTSDISKEIIDYANSMKDDETTVSFGTVIAPTDYLTGLSSFTMDALKGAGKTYQDIPAKDGIVENEDGSKTINAALIDLLPENYDRAFSAVSYVKYVKNGNTVYIYSNYDSAKNSRSIAQVAQAAIDSGDYTGNANALEILNGYLK